jgi:hypothetical protein
MTIVASPRAIGRTTDPDSDIAPPTVPSRVTIRIGTIHSGFSPDIVSTMADQLLTSVRTKNARTANPSQLTDLATLIRSSSASWTSSTPSRSCSPLRRSSRRCLGFFASRRACAGRAGSWMKGNVASSSAAPACRAAASRARSAPTTSAVDTISSARSTARDSALDASSAVSSPTMVAESPSITR